MRTNPSHYLITASLMLFSACGTKGEDSAVVTKEGGGPGASASPSADMASARGTSMVRFVNAIPGSGPLAVVSDSVELFGAVKSLDVSPYREVGDNVKKFSLRGAGEAGQLDANREAMRDGGRYTMYAVSDRDGGASLRIVRDDLTPEPGKARIRVLHAAAGVDDVDVRMEDQKDALFDDVSYGDEAGFKDIMPVSTSFVVRKADGSRDIQTVKRMDLKAGTAYTILLTTKRGGGLNVNTFSDSMTTP